MNLPRNQLLTISNITKTVTGASTIQEAPFNTKDLILIDGHNTNENALT
jgi:hypothetical protein